MILSPPQPGLFDFQDVHALARFLSHALDLSVETVFTRLYLSALEPGANVRRAAMLHGITPHVHDAAMARLYAETDAFVFDLCASHQRTYTKEIDNRVIEAVQLHAIGNPACRILVLGDGIGTDSLRFAASGFPVTYFEFLGPSAKVAASRFARSECTLDLQQLHDVADLPSNAFDVVICREVLEHVQDPPGLVRAIWSYLRPSGIAVITESFARVEPAYPTHLRSNLRFVGLTPLMFQVAGFGIERSYPRQRPLVFRKAYARNNLARIRWWLHFSARPALMRVIRSR